MAPMNGVLGPWGCQPSRLTDVTAPKFVPSRAVTSDHGITIAIVCCGVLSKNWSAVTWPILEDVNGPDSWRLSDAPGRAAADSGPWPWRITAGRIIVAVPRPPRSERPVPWHGWRDPTDHLCHVMEGAF
jgi:hypothetical protein